MKRRVLKKQMNILINSEELPTVFKLATMKDLTYL